MNHLIKIKKADGTRELFEESKLTGSLKNAGGSDQVIEEILYLFISFASLQKPNQCSLLLKTFPVFLMPRTSSL